MKFSIDVKKILSTFLFGAFCIVPAYSAEPDCEAYRNGIRDYDNGHYNSAFSHFVKANKLAPDNGYIYYYIGNIMYMANNPQKAYEFAIQSLEYFGPEDTIATSDAYQFLAFLANYSSDGIVGLSTEETEKYYDLAVEIAPTYWKAYLERGNWYNIHRKEYSRSDADYIKAIKYNAKEVEPYSRLIWSYEERGMYEEAEKFCRMCMEADLGYPHHYDILAKLLLKKGKKEEARDILWKAFVKSKGYYFQGMSAVSQFEEEDQQWFFNQIRCQAETHPDQTYWQEYLK